MSAILTPEEFAAAVHRAGETEKGVWTRWARDSQAAAISSHEALRARVASLEADVKEKESLKDWVRDAINALGDVDYMGEEFVDEGRKLVSK